MENATQPRYVQFGAGFSVGPSWENFDNSPSMILSRLPAAGAIFRCLGAIGFPPETRYGDIVAKPLAPEGTCAGIYASHVLEHLSLNDMETALRHVHLMLRKGGTFRLIVPDLAGRAEIYLRKFAAGDPASSNFFMRSTYLGTVNRPRSLRQRVRAQFGNSDHLWMWDEPTMFAKLAEAGFTSIRRCRFGDSDDPKFAEVESIGRFRDEELDLDELAVECRK